MLWPLVQTHEDPAKLNTTINETIIRGLTPTCVALLRTITFVYSPRQEKKVSLLKRHFVLAAEVNCGRRIFFLFLARPNIRRSLAHIQSVTFRSRPRAKTVVTSLGSRRAHVRVHVTSIPGARGLRKWETLYHGYPRLLPTSRKSAPYWAITDLYDTPVDGKSASRAREFAMFSRAANWKRARYLSLFFSLPLSFSVLEQLSAKQRGCRMIACKTGWKKFSKNATHVAPSLSQKTRFFISNERRSLCVNNSPV